jgi:hypothetical protein
MNGWLQVIGGVLLCAFLGSCATSTADLNAVKESATRGITVIESHDCKPRFLFIGSTAFTNHVDEISDPGFSFADHLVFELRRRGYRARKAETSGSGPEIRLSPSAPYGEPILAGGSVGRRNLFGYRAGFVVFCNYRGSFVDSSRNLSVSERFTFDEPQGFVLNIGLKSDATRWNSVSASEKQEIRSALQDGMDRVARTMIRHFGL